MALFWRTLLLSVLALALAIGLGLMFGSAGARVSTASAHALPTAVQGMHPQTSDGFDCDNPFSRCHFCNFNCGCQCPPTPPACNWPWGCFSTAPLGPCGGFSGQGKCGGYGCPTIYVVLGGNCPLPLGKAAGPALALGWVGTA